MLAAGWTGCDTAVPEPSPSTAGLRVTGSTPADGAQDAARRGWFVVRFNRPLATHTVHRGTVELQSGPQRVFLSMHVDPLERAIRARTYGTFSLEPDAVYRLTVHPEVRDLDGESLPEAFEARFRTGEVRGPVPQLPTVRWWQVEPLLRVRCADEIGCHTAAAPALGLDLSSAEGVRRTGIGVAARQVASGAAGPEGVAGAPGLAGMPIIDALAAGGSPATSYLLYKVLGDPHILGDPMPPGQLVDADGRLSEGELRLLSDWILAGAPTE